MKYVKILLWSLAAVFFVVGLFKDGIYNFSDAIVLLLLGTILLIESIEYNRKDIRFYNTFLWGILAYFLAAYIFFDIYFYLAFINLLGFSLFGLDKYKAIRKKWRIPEASLLLAALAGGAPGCLLGMLFFRHKIRKPKFYLLIPLLLVLEYGLGIYLFIL